MKHEKCSCEPLVQCGTKDNPGMVGTVKFCPLHKAAPEMLEALKLTIPMLVKLGDFMGNGSTEYPHSSLGERCDIILAVKGAIAKAEGGEE